MKKTAIFFRKTDKCNSKIRPVAQESCVSVVWEFVLCAAVVVVFTTDLSVSDIKLVVNM